MKTWKIKTRDPLIFRDGKPFNASASAIAKSLPFPFPSTIAGAVRTQMGTDPNTGVFNLDKIDEIKTKQIVGPLLLEESNNQVKMLVPAPADCLMIESEEDEQSGKMYYLKPLEQPKEISTNLNNHKNKKIIGPSQIIKNKPIKNAPKFWYWDQYKEWLLNPFDQSINISQLGIAGFEMDERFHNQIDNSTGTTTDGALFQTNGLVFNDYHNKKSFIFQTDAELNEGYVLLGGEKRAGFFEQTNFDFPKDCPDSIKSNIQELKGCRIILLTPAKFENGSYPNKICKDYKIEIVGQVSNRYQVVSGWDYELNMPKPTIRLTPAGSVYFINFTDDSLIDKFIENVWMQNISDDDQAQKDGFGLAILGTWNPNNIAEVLK